MYVSSHTSELATIFSQLIDNFYGNYIWKRKRQNLNNLQAKCIFRTNANWVKRVTMRMRIHEQRISLRKCADRQADRQAEKETERAAKAAMAATALLDRPLNSFNCQFWIIEQQNDATMSEWVQPTKERERDRRRGVLCLKCDRPKQWHFLVICAKLFWPS